MGKYKVVNPEDQIGLTEITPIHKLNMRHRILKENNDKFIIALANINGDEEYDIEENIIGTVCFSNLTKQMEGVDNADLLEIVLERLKSQPNKNQYTAEAAHAIMTALVFLSIKETDFLIEATKAMHEMQMKEKEDTETEETPEDETEGGEENE